MPFDPAEADLDEVARRARVSDAVRERHRRTAATSRRREGTTVVSALLGALDRPVTIHTTAGPEPFHGTVVAVGDDVVELDAATRTWWLRVVEITAVEAAELLPGDPADRSTTSLVELLADLVDTDRPVTVLVRSGARFRGTVTSVGASLWLHLEHRAHAVLIELDHVVGVAQRSDPTAR
jgi:small nuclear ribonucleoprotein (snRNP)-like protein